MIRILLSLILLQLSFSSAGAQITITPDSSLADAVRKAREMQRLGKCHHATIHLTAGIYHLYEPLRIRPEDEGLTIEGDGAVISGGIPVTGWKKAGKLWVADVPDFNGCPIDFRQVWVNGRKAVRARDVSDYEQMDRILGAEKSCCSTFARRLQPMGKSLSRDGVASDVVR